MKLKQFGIELELWEWIEIILALESRSKEVDSAIGVGGVKNKVINLLSDKV
jgi:hypothetical protein